MQSVPIDGVPREGELIAGKYRMEAVLGRGGMGVVVAAQHLTLGQRVAVKFLLPEAMRLPEATGRFLREARAAASIQCEHVARIIDVGTLDSGAPYIVMEYLTGIDLRGFIRTRGPCSVSEAVDLVLEACVAIAEAHAHGIVHRDLKPSNLFLADRPNAAPIVKVLDFGLSKPLQADAEGNDDSLTATDVVMGSFHYMCPEQIRSMKNADTRADIWALGAILFELITARRPFEAASIPELIVMVTEDPPALMESFGVQVPARLQLVILRCLDKNRELRPQTVADLAVLLEPFSTSAARPLVERILRWQRTPRASDTSVTVRPPALAARQRSGVFGDEAAPESPAFRMPPASRQPAVASAFSGEVKPLGAPSPGAGRGSGEPPEPSSRPSAPALPGSQPPASAESTAPRVRPLQVLIAIVALALGACAALVVALIARRAPSAEIDPERLASFAPLPSGAPGAPNQAVGERIRLGRMLFYEPRLSRNKEVSCNSCHVLDAYGVDGKARSRGSGVHAPERNTLGVYNLANAFALLWDGRQSDLAEQAEEVLLSPKEMASSKESVETTLAAIRGYPGEFARAFPDDQHPVSLANVSRALAAFEGTLNTRGRWDRFLEGDRSALTARERAGFNKFVEVGCISCHFGSTVGMTMFQKLGLVRAWPDTRDRGRYEFTRQDADWMVFRVPSLRNVARTAPYFHDGSVTSLGHAVKLMARHQIGRELDDEDVGFIVSWLESLTGEIPRDAITLDPEAQAIVSGAGP
jgi:eukaryotic-like serine/threonine-protein kinase